jgi:hypothetical protein
MTSDSRVWGFEVRLLRTTQPITGLETMAPGNRFRPFIEHRGSSSLSSKTIRWHAANLWILGGEIIRDLLATREEWCPNCRTARHIFRFIVPGGCCRGRKNAESELTGMVRRRIAGQ